jgi:hypothetical protein
MPRKQNDEIGFLPDDVAAGEPDMDLTPDDEEELDLGALRVNFSDEEAASEGRTFEPVPSGSYACQVVKVEVRKSKSSKNFGKPYYSLSLQVIKDADRFPKQFQYGGKYFFGSVMLFEGALYSLAQLHKALGWPMNGSVIPPEELIDKELLVIVSRQKDDYTIKKAKEAGEELIDTPYKNEVKGYKPMNAKVGPGLAKGDSLLPS